MRKEERKGRRRIGLTVVALALFFCLISTITLAGVATVVRVDPATQTVTAGGSFSVDVRVDDVTGMGDDEADLNFNPGAMQATGIVEGDWLKNCPGGGGTLKIENIDNTNGIVTFSYALMTEHIGVNGDGILATINFDTFPTAAPGTYNLNLANGKLSDGDGDTISGVSWSNGKVTIQPFPVPGLSGTGMIAAIGVLAIVLAISSVRRKRRK